MQAYVERVDVEPEIERPRQAEGRHRARLLAVIATVLVVALLKWSAAATMPVAFAIFLIVLAWPLERRLERRLPRGLSLALTLLALLALFTAFVAALVWSGQMIAERSPQYLPRIEELAGKLPERLRSELPLPSPEPAEEASEATSLGGAIKTGAFELFRTVSLIVLVAAFTVLGLLEVRDFRRKVERAFSSRRARAIFDDAGAIVEKFHRYLVARTLAGGITGVATGLFAWGVGLDFALVWGLTNFLLNYVPTLGSIVAVFPPVLFALVQFEGLTMPLVVLAGVGGIQLLMGNYIDPLIQGKMLALSPLVVLVSIVFWGWVWGIPGALLGVPITIGVILAAHHFDSTRWIAVMLSDADGPSNLEDSP